MIIETTVSPHSLTALRTCSGGKSRQRKFRCVNLIYPHHNWENGNIGKRNYALFDMCMCVYNETRKIRQYCYQQLGIEEPQKRKIVVEKWRTFWGMAGQHHTFIPNQS